MLFIMIGLPDNSEAEVRHDRISIAESYQKIGLEELEQTHSGEIQMANK